MYFVVVHYGKYEKAQQTAATATYKAAYNTPRRTTHTARQ